MSLNILSFEPISEKQNQLLQDTRDDIRIRYAAPAEAAPFLKDADILLSYSSKLDIDTLLPAMPNLKWLHSYSDGVDKLTRSEKFVNSGIVLTNSRGIQGIATAETVIGLMLADSRGLYECHDNQQKNIWQKPQSPDELYDKNVAIIGLGSIGREVAKRLRPMGMKILAIKNNQTIEPFVDKLYTLEGLDFVLSKADYVVVSLPLTDKTRNLFTMDKFNIMKPNTFFINVSRGALVDENALIEALNTKKIKGAALDVFNTEPLPKNSILWQTKNLHILPHTSATSPNYLQRSLRIFKENLRLFPNIPMMINVVDKKRGY